jgi:DNA-binding NarL/FixJ family response regulator
MIVDDHKIFRDGLKLLLRQFPFVGKSRKPPMERSSSTAWNPGFPALC